MEVIRRLSAVVNRSGFAAAVSIPLLLLGARLASACPLCAGDSASADFNVWPIVGAFILVPPLLGSAVFLAVRRESRSDRPETPSPL